MLIEILGSRDRGVSSNLKALFSPPPAEGAGAAPQGGAVLRPQWRAGGRGASPPWRLPPPRARRHLAAGNPRESETAGIRKIGKQMRNSRGVEHLAEGTPLQHGSQAPSSLALNTDRHGAALGSLSQCLTTLTWKNLSLISQLNPSTGI